MVSLNKMRCSKKLSELVIKVRRIRIERCRCAISISNSNGIPSSTYIYIYILTWFVPQIRSFHPRFFLFFLSFFTEFHISLRGIRLPSVTRNVEWWDEREKRRERNGGREEETDGPGERGSGWLTNKRSFRSVAREYFMRSDERRSRGDGRDFEITIGGGKRGRGGDARERVSKKRRWTGTDGGRDEGESKKRREILWKSIRDLVADRCIHFRLAIWAGSEIDYQVSTKRLRCCIASVVSSWFTQSQFAIFSLVSSGSTWERKNRGEARRLSQIRPRLCVNERLEKWDVYWRSRVGLGSFHGWEF